MTPLDPEDYKQHHGEKFERQKVVLDGCWFDRCGFDHCVLVVEGKLPFAVTRWTGTITVVATEEATELIRSLAISFGDDAILTMLNDVRLQGGPFEPR